MVTLINPFEVQGIDEADFLAYWQAAADFMCTQEGFISSDLHQTLMTGGRFSFVNIAVWASGEDFQRAVNSPKFKALTEPKREQFPHFPGLYQSCRRIVGAESDIAHG